MTAYSVAESSIEAGEPVELFKFDYGTTTYAFTSGDTAVTHAGVNYLPEPIERSESELTQDMTKALMTLDTTKDNAIARLFLPGALSGILFTTIYRQHTRVNDSSFVVIYKGKVTNCSLAGMSAKLTCEPIFTSLKRNGLRRTYEPSCPLMLYSPACAVNKANFKLSGPVTTFDGRKQLTVPVAATKPDGWLNGGIIVINGQPHMISNHVGALVTLMRHWVGTSITGNIDLYPGCDHTRVTCSSKFNNILNYGGYPWMSAKNPFTGDSVQWISGK